MLAQTLIHVYPLKIIIIIVIIKFALEILKPKKK